MQNITDKIASTHLGKKSVGSETYDSTLLVVVPREENRKIYNIESNNLPFMGYDVWHGYEFSVLTSKGLPVTRVLKLKYNCNNEFLIESKSLKLYLNSFNMSRFGESIKECLEICKNIIKKDLSDKLETEVEIEFISNSAKRIEIYNQFENIMDYVDEKELVINEFKEAPQVLEFEEITEVKEYYLTFDSLRSNCRVTHQPDFGDAFIYYKSSKHILESSLVKYLSSFRSEYHFHEECCEMIFKRLKDLLNGGDELFVSALYTRRGGIDICPSRWTTNCSFNEVKKLLDISCFARSGNKQ